MWCVITDSVSGRIRVNVECNCTLMLTEGKETLVRNSEHYKLSDEMSIVWILSHENLIVTLIISK